MAPRPIDVEVRAVGVDGVRRHLKLLGEEGGNAQEKFSRAGERVAGVLAMIAHHGELSTREMKELVREGGEMLTLFGGGGAIIGGVALLGAAFVEAFSRGSEAMEKLRDRTQEYATEYRKLVEEFRGNQLGVKELDLDRSYNKAVAEINKQTPGFFSAMWSVALAGISSLAGGGAFNQDLFNAYAGPKLGARLGLRQQQDIRTQGEQNIQKEAEEDAAKKLEEARKRAFEGAAYLAANDLESNDNFIRILAPAWTQMWTRFGLDAEVRKDTAAINRGMIERTITDAMGEVGGVGRSGVTGALAGLDALQKKGPLLGSFSSSFKKEFDSITQSVNSTGEALGTLAAQAIPTLADGFASFFLAVGSGQNVFKAFANIATQAIAQVASKMAAEEFAQGVAMVARSIWDFLGPNPAAAGSASQHFAAAALFGAIAGGATAVGGGAGGGYGRGFGGGGLSASSVAATGGGQGSVHISLPFEKFVLDASDPETRAQFAAILQKLFGNREIVFDAPGGG